MSKSYYDLEQENMKLKQYIAQQQDTIVNLRSVIDRNKDTIAQQQKDILKRNDLLMAFQNRLVGKPHWWQRIIQDKQDTNYLLSELKKMWHKDHQNQ